jgi:hypothetical protein
MMVSAIRPILCCAAAGAILAIGACASNDQPDSGDGDDSSTSIPPPLPDADGSDSDADAGTDADASVEAGTRICSDDHFCHSVLPADQELHGVWGDGSGVVWAVSTAGSILRWEGSAWKVHASGLDELTAVWGSGPTDIWVGGKQGLFHGTGATPATLVFVPVANLPGDPTYPITSIWGTGPNDVWAVGGVRTFFDNAGRVLHYAGPSDDEAGTDWTLDDLSSQPFAFGTVWGTPEGGAWIQGAGPDFDVAGVYHRNVGSTTWDPVTLPADPSTDLAPEPDVFTAAGSSTASSIWLVGRTGDFNGEGYWHGTSTDNGSTVAWTYTPRPFGSLGLNAIWGLGVDDTWGAGPSGRLAHWDGANWAQAAILVTALPVTKTFYAIWGLSNDDFWIVGDNIALHKTTGTAP